MERQVFAHHLSVASTRAIEAARTMVTELLSGEVLYLVSPNQSFDGNPLVGDEQLFPEDTLAPGRIPVPITANMVVSFLWRNGKVPEWINVRDVADGATYLALDCCGRFTASEDLLYHRQAGVPPFHVLSPCLPPEWKRGDPPFSLRWRLGRFE